MTPSPAPPGTKQVLLAFSSVSSDSVRLRAGDIRRFTEGVQRPFLPLGLFLWGPTDDTYVHGVRIGNMMEVGVGHARMPGRYFTVNRSFSELGKLAEIGELEVAVEARQLFEMTEATVGSIVGVDIEGPFAQVCLWGLTYTSGSPAMRAEVVWEESTALLSGKCKGQLIERRLRGDQVIAEVSAPSEESVCTLLAALRNPRMY